jgi:hypothetical protein
MLTESIREILMQAIKDAIVAMDPAVYWNMPRLVRREYIHPLTTQVYPQVSILDTTEAKTPAGTGGALSPFGFVQSSLSLTLHVADKANGTTERATLISRWVSDLERILATFDNRTVGGASMHVMVTGNDIELTEIEPPLVLGAVYATVDYQHIDGDPTRGN